MDKDTLRNLLVSAVIFLGILWVLPKIIREPQQQTPSPAGEVTDAAEDTWPPSEPSSAGQVPGGTVATSSEGEPLPAETGRQPAQFIVDAAESAQTFALGSAPGNGMEADADESPYRMRLVLSNVGASVESATMTDHAESLGSEERYELLSVVESDNGTTYRSLPVEAINVDDVSVALHDQNWHTDGVQPLASSAGPEGETIEFWIDVLDNGQPALRVWRTFTLPRQTVKSGRHDLTSDIRVENLSERPHRVIISYRGGVGVRRTPASRVVDQYVDWGVFRDGYVTGTRKAFADLAKSPDQAINLYKPSPEDLQARFVWAATANTYFTCTVAPLPRDGVAYAQYLSKVRAVDLDGSALTADDVSLRFAARPITLQPGQSVPYPATVYLGQKNSKAFKVVEEYGARNYYYQISQGFGFCTFTFLVELMIWLLNSLFVVARDFGVAIMILVLVVRVLLHPITKKGQVNMVRMQHRMQEMAPKIEEIKKKYANDKARLNQEMMKLNINPAGQLFTCLPMLIQMPIWIALFLSLSNNIMMRHEPCIFLPWIHDLTAPDALYTFSRAIRIPLVGWTIESFNLLPLLVALFMYTQQKLQPKPTPSPNATDQQKQQQEMMQKMMPMMSIMMLVIFYKMPSGLNLYIMTSSLFGTIEQKRIRKHIKDHEQAGTLHKPEKPRAPKADAGAGRRKSTLLQKLQKAAEEAQQVKSKRRK